MQSQLRELAALEDMLNQEVAKLDQLRQTVDRDIRDRNTTTLTMNKNIKEAKFFHGKIKHESVDKLTRQLEEIPTKTLQIRREKLNELRRAIDQFDNLQPTNEALKAKIDDLKKSRLSLEVSFM